MKKGCGVFLRSSFATITGYIYFIQMENVGAIKIGITRDVNRRLIALQTSSPYPLHILCFFPGNEEMERELHIAFDDLRLSGEWFLPWGKIFECIKEQKRLNERNGFVKANPEHDFGNWNLDSDRWDTPCEEVFNA